MHEPIEPFQPTVAALVRYFPAHRFDPAPVDFFIDTLFLRTAGRFRRSACKRHNCDACHHFMQTLQRFFLVFFLAAVCLGLDDNDTFLADALVVQPQQPFLEVFGQRRCANVEAQMDRAGNLVHVLTARTLGTNCAELDFARGNGRRQNDVDPLSEWQPFYRHKATRPAGLNMPARRTDRQL